MYYNVMTMTVTVILNSCSLEKQDDGYDQSQVHGKRKWAYRKCNKDALT
jgi:hypothetical protein